MVLAQQGTKRAYYWGDRTRTRQRDFDGSTGSFLRSLGRARHLAGLVPRTEWVRVDGPVAVGTRGALKPQGGPKAKFVISACVCDTEYTDTTLLPGARLVFQHTVDPAEPGSDLRVRVTMQGRLSLLWARVMGGQFRHSAQADLDRLVRLVEQP